MMTKLVIYITVLLVVSACHAMSSTITDMQNKATEDGGVVWAVLAAGSHEWSNYRHQADLCHAYQVLHRHGIPDERIIVMMYVV